jgi:hypothetical protein
MFRLIETASSALAAASVLAMALGCAILSKPSWADEPLPPSNCGNCVQGNCGNVYDCDAKCLNSQGGCCDCKCTPTTVIATFCPFYYTCQDHICS